MSRRVVVTGLGLVTPLGVGIGHVWPALLAARSGIRSLVDGNEPSGSETAVDSSGSGSSSAFAALPCRIAATVPRGSRSAGRWDSREWLQPGDGRTMSLFTQYAVAAAEQALLDGSYRPATAEARDMMGVCCGSGIGSFEDVVQGAAAYAQGYRKLSPLFVPRLLINMAAGHLSMRYGLRVWPASPALSLQLTPDLGPNHSVATACTTGLHAIGDASRFIQFGDANVMLAGGSEACVHPLAMAGFCRLKSLSTNFNDNPTAASRPFDRDRDGFVLGEGAGMVLLEEREHALARGARIYAELAGYGLSSDANHMTAPPPDGAGAALAMQRAITAAKVATKDVDYINAHATSTPQGDLAENRAIKRVFGAIEGHSDHSKINISSTKGAIGHLLGAAGAVESIFAILAMHHNILPPTLNLENFGEPKDEFTCNYVPKISQECNVSVAMSNSSGFGGTNAALCFIKS